MQAVRSEAGEEGVLGSVCGSPGSHHHSRAHRTVPQEQATHVRVRRAARQASCHSCTHTGLRWSPECGAAADRNRQVGDFKASRTQSSLNYSLNIGPTRSECISKSAAHPYWAMKPMAAATGIAVCCAVTPSVDPFFMPTRPSSLTPSPDSHSLCKLLFPQIWLPCWLR